MRGNTELDSTNGLDFSAGGNTGLKVSMRGNKKLDSTTGLDFSAGGE
jgi:hypothetical protein